MPLLLALIGLFAPRFVTIVLWLASGWFDGVFETRLWPILGFIFLPFTLLWYSVVMQWFNGSWDVLQVIVLVLAVITDLSSGRRATRR